MKKYNIHPVKADIFYSPEYQVEHPDIYKDSLNHGFVEILRKEYVTNGLLSFSFWYSEHIFESFELSNFHQYILVSKSLKYSMIKAFNLDESLFLPIACGFELDHYKENVSLSDFYSFSLGFINDESKLDFIAIQNIKGSPIQIVVTEQFLNIILSFDNEDFKYREFQNN